MADELTVSIRVDATSDNFTEENIRLVDRTIDVSAGTYKHVRLEIDVGTSTGKLLGTSNGPGDYYPGGYLIIHHVGAADGTDDMKPAYIFGNSGEDETVKIKAGEAFLFRTSSVLGIGEPRARFNSGDSETNNPVLDVWYFEA